MEQQTPIPPHPILDLGGKGGLGFPFILSKIVGFSQRNRILCREDKFFNSWSLEMPYERYTTTKESLYEK